MTQVLTAEDLRELERAISELEIRVDDQHKEIVELQKKIQEILPEFGKWQKQ